MKKLLLIIGVILAMNVDAEAYKPDAMWTYKTVKGKELKMSVFLPKNYKTGKKFPTIVIFHGGSWTTGEASWHYPDCAYWTKRGMIAVSVDYRLKKRDNIKVPLECIKDCKSSIRFLVKNAKKLKVDTEKIVVAGGSAGGQLAAAMAMIDSPHTNDDSYDTVIPVKPAAVILYNPWFKCQKDLSPPNFIRKGLPPFIIFLGDKDIIPVNEILKFHKDLKKVGNKTEFYLGKNGKHGFCNGRNARNRFFYWSLELGDKFMVKHGILNGKSKVKRPSGVTALKENEFKSYK